MLFGSILYRLLYIVKGKTHKKEKSTTLRQIGWPLWDM